MLAPVMGSIQFKIPICHIEGGDLTEGAIDDNIRHAITKLSHLHFASQESGEIPLLGCPAIGYRTPWRLL